MKRRIYYFIVYICILVLCLYITEVSANATAFWYRTEDPILRSFLILFLFSIGTSIEYGVHLFNFKIKKIERKILLKSCFKVNFITFPITQAFAYIIFVYAEFFFWVYTILVQILVIHIEWGLFKLDIDNRIKSFDIFTNYERFVSKKILIGSILANCTSFFVGLLAYLPPIILFSG